jgi:hypothetical protein
VTELNWYGTLVGIGRKVDGIDERNALFACINTLARTFRGRVATAERLQLQLLCQISTQGSHHRNSSNVALPRLRSSTYQPFFLRAVREVISTRSVDSLTNRLHYLNAREPVFRPV